MEGQDTALQQVARGLNDLREQVARAIPFLSRAGGPKYGKPVELVLARVEDPNKTDAPPPYITEELIDEVVETYNPDERPAHVIAGFSRDFAFAGPAHWTGEYLPPLGVIRGDGDVHVWRDGNELRGYVRQIIDPTSGKGRIDQIIAEGALARSVLIATESKEVGGRAQLLHLAILGAEQPGQRGLPPLDQVFVADELAERSASEWRFLGIKPDTIGGELACRSFAFIDGRVQRDQQEPEAMDLTDDQLDRIINGVAEKLKAAAPAPAADEAKGEDEEETQEAAATARALNAIADRLEKLEGRVSDAQTAARSAQDNATAQRVASMRQRLGKLVSRGFLQPFKAVALEREIFADGVPLAVAEQSIVSLETAAQAARSRMSVDVRLGDDQAATVDLSRYAVDGVVPQIDQNQVALVARARAHASKYPEAERQAQFEQYLYGQAGSY